MADAEHLALGRLLSLLGRSFSTAQGLGGPLPATVLSVASQSPGTWAHHALAVCAHLDIPSPLTAGIHPQSPPHRVRRWVDLVVSLSLNLALRQRLQASIYSLSTTRLPDGATFSVNAGPDVFVYGRGSSPEHARFWSLARWGHDPLPCGRPARHLGLHGSCRFRDASVGICGTPCLSAPSLPICVPSGPVDTEFHRNLHRHRAAIPGSLILHLFSILPVRYVLTSILLVLYVSGLTRPAPYDFSLVRFCFGGPLLAVSRCEWQ